VNWRAPFAIYLIALLLLVPVLLLLPEPVRPSTTSTGDTIEPTQLSKGLVFFTYGMALITQAAFYMIPVQIPFYLQELTSATAAQSGLAIALSTLFIAGSSFAYQSLKSRFTFVRIYEIAFVSLGVGYLIISLAQGLAIVLAGLAIAGLGVGLLVPNMNLCLASITPPAQRGRVLGGWTTCFFLGQFLSPLLSQPLSQNLGLAMAYRIAGGLVILVGVATVAVMNRPIRTAASS
jgi:MFS family permease